jgi:hypothetical protein
LGYALVETAEIMKGNIIAAIVALGLVIAAFVMGGRYSLSRVDQQSMIRLKPLMAGMGRKLPFVPKGYPPTETSFAMAFR